MKVLRYPFVIIFLDRNSGVGSLLFCIFFYHFPKTGLLGMNVVFFTVSWTGFLGVGVCCFPCFLSSLKSWISWNGSFLSQIALPYHQGLNCGGWSCRPKCWNCGQAILIPLTSFSQRPEFWGWKWQELSSASPFTAESRPGINIFILSNIIALILISLYPSLAILAVDRLETTLSALLFPSE